MKPTSMLNYGTFRGFKGFSSDLNTPCVLICTGPSLSKISQEKLDLQLDHPVTVGVNEAVFANLRIDYLFVQDTKPTHDYGYAKKPEAYNTFDSYEKGTQLFKSVKFAGKAPQIPTVPTIPWEDIHKFGWLPYEIGREGACDFQTDIHLHPLGDGNSVAFSAAQFALFTGITTLYLVGVDITPRETILDKPPGDFHPYLHWNHKDKWQIFKLWAKSHYPETKIVSVNPVGLKGMFEEIEI